MAIEQAGGAARGGPGGTAPETARGGDRRPGRA